MMECGHVTGIREPSRCRLSTVEFTSEASDEADFKPEKSKTPKKTAPQQPPAVQVCYVFLLQLNP